MIKLIFQDNKPITPNLLERKFNVEQPNRYFVRDITYITTDEGWLYLAAVIDGYLVSKTS